MALILPRNRTTKNKSLRKNRNRSKDKFLRKNSSHRKMLREKTSKNLKIKSHHLRSSKSPAKNHHKMMIPKTITTRSCQQYLGIVAKSSKIRKFSNPKRPKEKQNKCKYRMNQFQ